MTRFANHPNPLNNDEPIRKSRDTTELPPDIGKEICLMFDTPILKELPVPVKPSHIVEKKDQKNMGNKNDTSGHPAPNRINNLPKRKKTQDIDALSNNDSILNYETDKKSDRMDLDDALLKNLKYSYFLL